LELKIKTIAKAWKNSSAVLIATSPGYIDQEDARKIIEVFIK
jgi:predicted ABC-type transport system involved in lysophospholipase L1 biosynthesis ATPase subunit